MSSTPAILDTGTLIRVRWFGTAILATVLLVGSTTGMVPSPALPISLGLIAAASLLNGGFHTMGKPALGPILLLDIGVLTAMLALSGGAMNPFTLLYLLPVLMAALALSTMWSLGLTVVSTACFAGLVATADPHAHHHMDMSQHLIGMVIAYAVTVPLVAAAVHRFRTAVAEANEASARARASLAASERISSLAALAAGAAHELRSPMSTILLIARELERETEGDVQADLHAIAEEVQHCGKILDQLSVDVGANAGEASDELELTAFVANALSGQDVDIDADSGVVCLPPSLTAQALRQLVKNARHAAGPEGNIAVRARMSEEEVRFEVEDDGPGMSAEVRSRALEPFFTTKAEGFGRGLGLFFVHSLADQLGGRFEIDSTEGEGTLCVLVLPGGIQCASS